MLEPFDSKMAKVDFRQLVEMMVDADLERLTAASATARIPAR